MGDLIDREAAIEAIYDFMVCGSFAFLQCGGELEEELKRVPSIPAVPLEPLCKWLAENALDIHKRRTTPLKQGAKNWETLIRGAMEKWMEELDATDRC